MGKPLNKKTDSGEPPQLDDVLKRMLSTPPQPRVKPKQAAKPAAEEAGQMSRIFYWSHLMYIEIRSDAAQPLVELLTKLAEEGGPRANFFEREWLAPAG